VLGSCTAKSNASSVVATSKALSIILVYLQFTIYLILVIYYYELNPIVLEMEERNN
jgi:hypothetical protein